MPTFSKTALGLTIVGFMMIAATAGAQTSDGNRYFLERFYQGDISAAQAFLEAVVKKGKWTDRSDKLVILDVRDATEYKMGHPEGAYHMPFPRVYQVCPDDAKTEDGGSCTEGDWISRVGSSPVELFNWVEERFPDKSQRLATLCRTGFRSVRAANILTRPELFVCDPTDTVCVNEYTDRGYSNVYNIWQGFVGQPLAVVTPGSRLTVGSAEDNTPPLPDVTLDDGTIAKGFVAYDLDLNNDGDITAADKDGWRYHQALPYDTRMRPKLINDAVDAGGYYDMP